MSGAPRRTDTEAREILAAEIERLRLLGGALGETGSFAVAAWTLMHAYEFEAAEMGWAAAMEREPRDVENVFRHAHCLLELGHFERAADGFRAAMELDAELADAPGGEGLDWLEDDPAYRLGNCLHVQGDLAGAVEAYELSAGRNTIGVEALREMTRCHLAAERPDDALDALRRMERRAGRVGLRAEVLALRAEAERLRDGDVT